MLSMLGKNFSRHFKIFFSFMSKPFFWKKNRYDAHYAWKGPLCNWGECRFTQADQGLRYPLAESMNTVVHVCVDGQRMSSSDCTGEHAHLDLGCSPMVQYSFHDGYIVRSNARSRKRLNPTLFPRLSHAKPALNPR